MQKEMNMKKNTMFLFLVIEGEEYRVANSVLEQLQTFLEEKPEMTTFKVTKKGEGFKTSYQVVPLD